MTVIARHYQFMTINASTKLQYITTFILYEIVAQTTVQCCTHRRAFDHLSFPQIKISLIFIIIGFQCRLLCRWCHLGGRLNTSVWFPEFPGAAVSTATDMAIAYFLKQTTLQKWDNIELVLRISYNFITCWQWLGKMRQLSFQLHYNDYHDITTTRFNWRRIGKSKAFGL